MILCYNPRSKEWQLGAEAEKKICFGSNKRTVSSIPRPSAMDCFQFELNVQNGKAGPLIGIMSAINNKAILSGNGPLFRSLQEEIQKRNGMAIIFPPDKLTLDSVEGVVFVPKSKAWVQVTAPLPDIVYNRVPFRKAEGLPAFHDAVEFFSAMGIPFFNPGFINKNTLYSLFAGHGKLQGLMPESILIDSLANLAAFLKKNPRVYIKKASSSKGAGIYRLNSENAQIIFSSHSQRTSYPSLESFWNVMGDQLLKDEYLAQKEISPSCLGGRRFDFRIHAHDGPSGYQITGIGLRQSGEQDLTTHLPNGGRIVPYELVKNEAHDFFFSKIVKVIGELLSKELGYFGEFSVDAGLDENGNYVIYEVNSKPMSFDEPEIEKKRIFALADLLFRNAGYPTTVIKRKSTI